MCKEKQIFYEGQAVGCLMLGEGVIKSFMGLEFINVIINDKDYTYYIGGNYLKNGRPTLYPIEQYREIIKNLPAPEPEKWRPNRGEWCWFWDDIKAESVLRKFSIMNGNRFQCNLGLKWQNCAPFVGELPEHLKEVKS